MPSKTSLEWNGDELIDRVTRAATRAVNRTLDEAVNDAESSHTWVNRNNQLEDEIKAEHAIEGSANPNPTGKFGTTARRGFYGLFHEEGTVKEHETPFLRPAGDRAFPGLAEKIKEELGGS